MNNSEELATLCTQDTGGRQKEKQKTHQRVAMRTPPQNRVYNQAPTKGKQFMPLIRHPSLLLITFVDIIKITHLEW